MGVIKNLLLKVESLENMIKILEGKLNKLKINADLANSKPKELPDRNTYKPQQPYLGKGGRITLKLVLEGFRHYPALGDMEPSNVYWIPIKTTDEDKRYIFFIWYRNSQTPSDWLQVFMSRLYYINGTYQLKLTDFAGMWTEYKYKVYEIID